MVIKEYFQSNSFLVKLNTKLPSTFETEFLFSHCMMDYYCTNNLSWKWLIWFFKLLFIRKSFTNKMFTTGLETIQNKNKRIRKLKQVVGFALYSSKKYEEADLEIFNVLFLFFSWNTSSYRIICQLARYQMCISGNSWLIQPLKVPLSVPAVPNLEIPFGRRRRKRWIIDSE